MVRLLIPALLVSAACAQTLVDAGRVGNLVALLESRQTDGLHCDATTLPAVLDFSFRFRAGLTVRIPLGQFSGPGHRLGMLIEVRPEAGGAPVYLGRRFVLPESAPKLGSIGLGGRFLVGPGRYKARSVIYDETRRACHHDWEIQVAPLRQQGAVAMPANTVQELSAPRLATARGEPKLQTLTVLLDAAPINPRMSRLPVSDVFTLTSALISLLQGVPATRVRLVIFNLDLQKELLREDDFTANGIQRVEDMLNAVQVATVDYHVLQNRNGYLALLRDMVNRERWAAEPSDAVVFLTARVRYDDKVRLDDDAGHPGKPRFYSIQFRSMRFRGFRNGNDPYDAIPSVGRGGGRLPPEIPGRGRGGDAIPGIGLNGDYPDSIMLLVSRLKGHGFTVYSPRDFAKAIHRIIRANSS
jgi:hypothetical protein